jgi:hypothetical protein
MVSLLKMVLVVKVRVMVKVVVLAVPLLLLVEVLDSSGMEEEAEVRQEQGLMRMAMDQDLEDQDFLEISLERLRHMELEEQAAAHGELDRSVQDFLVIRPAA